MYIHIVCNAYIYIHVYMHEEGYVYTCMSVVECIHMCVFSRMDLIPFYARLVATLAPCMDDLAPTLVDILVRDFRFQVRKKDQIHIHSKIKNCRFIGTYIGQVMCT